MNSPPPSLLATHERRFQTVVVGGLVTLFAVVALAPHTERALFEDGQLPLAFAAVVPAAPPAIGTLRRFGYMSPKPFSRAFRTGRRSPGLSTNPPLGGPYEDPSTVFEADPFFANPADVQPPVLVADAGILSPVGVTPGGGLQFASFTPGAPGFAAGGAGPAAPAVTEPEPVATPTPAPTPAPTGTPTPTPTATPTPSPTATPAPEPGATPTPAPEPTGTPVPQPTSTPVPEPTATPTPLPTSTPIPEPTPTPTIPPIIDPTPEPPVTPVPEPASWMMLLAGLGIVAFTVRRSRRARGVATEA